MALVWQPQEAAAAQLCQLLAEFQRPGANQALAYQQLEQARSVPDFNNYLSFIFSKGDHLPIEVRQSAGLLLKNNLQQQYVTTTEDFRNYIKGDLLHVLSHPSRPLRHTAGIIITTIVGAEGLASWPELVVSIGGGLGSQEATTLEGVLDTLLKIVEDHPDQLDVKLTGASWGGAAASPQPVSCLLVPPLLALKSHRSPGTRAQALAVTTLMTGHMPLGLQDNIQTYIQALFELATDSEPSVRKEVCKGLVGLMTVQPDLLLPHMEQLIQYMLVCNQDQHQEVAVEAAEFWMAFVDAEVDPQMLKPIFAQLVPVLLKNMVFDEYDDEVADAEAEEQHPSGQDAGGQLGPGRSRRREQPGVGDEDEDDDDDGEAIRSWNLRKCSAAALDMLSIAYDDEEVLPLLLPLVQQNLQQEDWRLRESAILALGAVSEGCHVGLAPYLTGMFTMLVPRLSDPRPMVRIITCWTLSRYTARLFPEQNPDPRGPPATASPEQQQMYDAVLVGVLERVLDRNKFVQEAACSALSEMLEHSQVVRGQALLPRLKLIVDTLSTAIKTYSRRNLRNLIDALTTFCDTVPQQLADPALSHLLATPLFERWRALPLWEREGPLLMEGLTAMAINLREGFERYAVAVYDQAVAVLGSQVEAKTSTDKARHAAYEPDIYMASLDLLAGLADGLRASLDPLLAAKPITPVLLLACGDEAADVRQSGFALLGDLARGCPAHVMDKFSEFVGLCLASLEAPMLLEQNMPTCNNATWSLGELVIKAPPAAVQAVAIRMAETMAFILSGAIRVTLGLKENASITLGRVAWMAPAEIAPHLGHFCGPWCKILRSIRDDVEKEHAFTGLVRVVRLNPEPAASNFGALAAAVCSWRYCADEGLLQDMVQLMRWFKGSLTSSGRWQAAYAELEPPLQQKLASMCGVA